MFINADVAQDPTLPHTRGNLDKVCGSCGHDDAVYFQVWRGRPVLVDGVFPPHPHLTARA